MATCVECKSFFAVPENADDFETGKGDCVQEEKDDKGKFWLSKTVMGTMDSNKCLYGSRFSKRL